MLLVLEYLDLQKKSDGLKLKHIFPNKFVKVREDKKSHPEIYEESISKKNQSSAWARLIQNVFEAD